MWDTNIIQVTLQAQWMVGLVWRSNEVERQQDQQGMMKYRMNMEIEK